MQLRYKFYIKCWNVVASKVTNTYKIFRKESIVLKVDHRCCKCIWMVANCGLLTINHRAVKLRVNTNFLHLILFLPSLFSLFPLYLCSEYCVIAVHAFFHVVWMTFQDRFSAICHVLFSLCSLVSCFPNAISWNTFSECNPLEFKKLSAVHTFTNFKRFIIVAFCKPSNKSWNEAKKMVVGKRTLARVTFERK